jgi:acetyl esterase
MKKMLAYLTAGLLTLLAAAAAISYSWTFTPGGQLDYRAAIAAKLSAWSATPMHVDVATRTQANAAMAALMGGPMPASGFTQQDIQVPAPWGGIPVRLYRPEGEGPFPALLNFHGGGFWMGDGYIFDPLVVELALRARVAVFSVDYRLAPEHPFPAALEDSYRALQWVAENAARFDIDPARLGVMGQSAGGNLAAAVALKARDQGGPRLAFQSLQVPSVDLSDGREWPSFAEAGDDYFLKVSAFPSMRDAYVPRPEDRLDPYASPLLAEHHRDLPPALIIAAQFDPLRDQAIAYAEALRRGGVPVEMVVVPGVLHGFIGTPDRARENIEVEARALRRVFYPGLAQAGEESLR